MPIAAPPSASLFDLDPAQLDAASVGRLIPQPAFLICRFEYRKLLVLLRKVGLVEFRDPRTLPKHPVPGRVLVAGVLGAAKTGGAQRFLMDRRPLNALEDRLVGVPLPFVGDFVRIELGPNEIIRTSLRDGKDQYYVMDPGDARIGWQAFGHPVDPDWFPDVDLPGAPFLQLCFRGLIQGDHNATDIAEACAARALSRRRTSCQRTAARACAPRPVVRRSCPIYTSTTPE